MKPILKILEGAELRLRLKGIESAALDVRLLLGSVLKIKQLEIIARDHEIISESQKNEFDALLKRREKFEPMAYILGTKEFFGLDFFVDSSVLIPRPETESLVVRILEWINSKNLNSGLIIDLGTGSGCIVLSLASALGSEFEMIGLDISDAALVTAKRNAEKLYLSDRVKWIQKDFLKDEISDFENEFTVVVSNPPYIPAADISLLSEDIQNYEPLNALNGGDDGIQFYRSLFSEWYGRIQKLGLLAVETYGPEQIEKILELDSLKEKIKSGECLVTRDGPHLMIEKLV